MMNGYSNQVLPKPGGIWSNSQVIPAGSWKVLTPGTYNNGGSTPLPGVVLEQLAAGEGSLEEVSACVCSHAGQVFSTSLDLPIRLCATAPVLQYIGPYDSAVGGIPYKGVTTATGGGYFLFSLLGEVRVYEGLNLLADVKTPAKVEYLEVDPIEIYGRLIL